MTKTRFALAGLALAGGLLSLLYGATPARAQDKIIIIGATKAQIDPFFQGFDSDKSGTISFLEFSTKERTRLATLDTDESGTVTLAEFTADAANKPDKLEQRKKRFAGLDTDGDGSLTQAEFEAPRQRQFEEMDANCDGQLSWDEFAATVRNKPLPKSC